MTSRTQLSLDLVGDGFGDRVGLGLRFGPGLFVVGEAVGVVTDVGVDGGL